ncbi:MAG: hypothetical protein NXI01_03485 [Gammaproteobacteria bacterium]|nr:hypothetical protein [Gammaproteobacteria bacterium]
MTPFGKSDAINTYLLMMDASAVRAFSAAAAVTSETASVRGSAPILVKSYQMFIFFKVYLSDLNFPKNLKWRKNAIDPDIFYH